MAADRVPPASAPAATAGLSEVIEQSLADAGEETDELFPPAANERDPYFVLAFCQNAIQDALTLEDGLDAAIGASVLTMIDRAIAARPAAPSGEEAETDGDRRMLLVWEAWARREGNEGAALLFKRVADRLDELTAARNRWHGKWKAAHEGAERIEADLRARLTAQATALAALREAADTLAAFAKTAPGRLPQRVQDAIAALAPRQPTAGLS